MKLKKLHLLLLFLFFFIPVKSEVELSFYKGTFDTIDKEGDDKADLYGLEHNNPALFRETFIGNLSPISGGFITEKNSIYLYTGVQILYELGPLNIIPSFAPGYYEPGDGKDLGMALEFKSEIKLSLDIFENYKLGYSYSHISNNDWGDINPGVNNQTFSFSKIF
jgi:lipid A 3-O-deacylase